MTNQLLQHQFDAAEVEARESGYDLPVSAALRFIYENQDVLVYMADKHGQPRLAEEVKRIVDWIENGDPYYDPYDDEDFLEDD